MSRVLYEVVATVHQPEQADAWVRWMLNEHIAEVVRAGAVSGRLIRLTDSQHTFVSQYEFDSRAALDEYLARRAPELRADGARRFPPSSVSYARRTGDIIER